MIPAFNPHGLIPPLRPGEAGHTLDRAPYATDVLAFCQRFGGSPERRAILGGLLDLRAALAAEGIQEGFQWLDGSFTEDVESLRGRPPADLDAVTFARLGDAAAQRELLRRAPALFLSAQCKARYGVDHYVLGIDYPLDQTMGHRVAYWYSMWAHQRDTHHWKGFVSVALRSNDAAARAWLAAQATTAGRTP